MSKTKAPTKPDVVEEPTFSDVIVEVSPAAAFSHEKISKLVTTEPTHSFCGICNAHVTGPLDLHLAKEHA